MRKKRTKLAKKEQQNQSLTSQNKIHIHRQPVTKEVVKKYQTI